MAINEVSSFLILLSTILVLEHFYKYEISSVTKTIVVYFTILCKASFTFSKVLFASWSHMRTFVHFNFWNYKIRYTCQLNSRYCTMERINIFGHSNTLTNINSALLFLQNTFQPPCNSFLKFISHIFGCRVVNNWTPQRSLYNCNSNYYTIVRKYTKYYPSQAWPDPCERQRVRTRKAAKDRKVALIKCVGCHGKCVLVRMRDGVLWCAACKLCVNKNHNV